MRASENETHGYEHIADCLLGLSARAEPVERRRVLLTEERACEFDLDSLRLSGSLLLLLLDAFVQYLYLLTSSFIFGEHYAHRVREISEIGSFRVAEGLSKVGDSSFGHLLFRSRPTILKLNRF